MISIPSVMTKLSYIYIYICEYMADYNHSYHMPFIPMLCFYQNNPM